MTRVLTNEALDSPTGETIQDLLVDSDPVVVIVMILGPILLLREPTGEHILFSALIVAVGAAALVLAIIVLRRLPEEYRYEAEDDDGS